MSLTKIRQIDEISNTERGLKIDNRHYLKLPVASTLDRPGNLGTGSLGTPDPEPGMLRYNGDTKNIEIFLEDTNGNLGFITLGLGTESGAGGAIPQGDFLHRFGDIMYGDLRMASSVGGTAATAADNSEGSAFIQATGDPVILNSAGTEALPAYTFEGNSNTGMYRAGADLLAFSVNGLQAILVDGSAATAQNNTIVSINGNLNVLGTTTNVDTVNMVIQDNVIVLNKNEMGAGITHPSQVGGVEVERGSLDNAGWYYNETQDWWGPTGPSGTFGAGIGATQTLGNIQEIDTRDAVDTGILYVDGTAIRVRGTGARGTNLLPSFSWDADPDTGMYSSAANEVSLTAGGNSGLTLTTTGLVTTVPTLSTDGTEALPAFSFALDPDTGMWRAGTNNLQFSTGGLSRLEIRDNDIHVNTQLQLVDGSAVAPALNFQSDVATGIYKSNLNTLAIATNGNGKVFVNTTGLGIGIEPTERFHVADDGLGNGVALFTDTNVGTSTHEVKVGLLNSGNNNLTVGYDDANNYGYIAVDGDANTTALVVDDNSRIGVGERPDADAKLQTLGNVKHYFPDATRPSIQLSSLNEDPTMDFYRFNAGTAYDAVRFIQNNTEFSLQTGSAANIGSHTWATALTVNQNEQILLTNGSAALPSLSFINDTNTGLNLAAGDDLRFTVGGADRIEVRITDIHLNEQVQGINGTSSAPTYSFQADINSGLYSPAVDDVRLSVGSLDRIVVNPTNIITRVQQVGIDGTVALPSYSFESDPNSGIYSSGADSVSIATNGTSQVDVTTTTVTNNLDTIINSTGYLQLPTGVTAEQPGAPVNGMIRYNSTTNTIETYIAGSWVILAAGGGGLGTYVARSGDAMTGNLTMNGSSIMVGAPVGGATIAGTINAEDMFINNRKVATVDDAIAFSIVFGG